MLLQDLGQSYCDESTREAQWDFSSAIAQGGSAAQTAVAALVHAFMELVCIDGDQFITITEPPDERKSTQPCACACACLYSAVGLRSGSCCPLLYYPCSCPCSLTFFILAPASTCPHQD